jgi:PKD domain
MKRSIKYTSAAIFVALLSACGGGGSSGGNSENKPPIANAGNSLNALVGQAITLDGTKSTDPDNQKITYKWMLVTKPSDSVVYFDDTETEKPVLSNVKVGTYEAQLIVNDGIIDSSPSKVTVQVVATTVAPARAPTKGELGFMKDTIISVFPNYLRSPSTFKLIEGPTWVYYNTIGKPGEGAFTIKFDAQNGFGAIVRGNAICAAKWDDRGFWKNEIGNDLRICFFL